MSFVFYLNLFDTQQWIIDGEEEHAQSRILIKAICFGVDNFLIDIWPDSTQGIHICLPRTQIRMMLFKIAILFVKGI